MHSFRRRLETTAEGHDEGNLDENMNQKISNLEQHELGTNKSEMQEQKEEEESSDEEDYLQFVPRQKQRELESWREQLSSRSLLQQETEQERRRRRLLQTHSHSHGSSSGRRLYTSGRDLSVASTRGGVGEIGGRRGQLVRRSTRRVAEPQRRKRASSPRSRTAKKGDGKTVGHFTERKSSSVDDENDDDDDDEDDPFWMETLAGSPSRLESALREAVLRNDLRTVRTLLNFGGVNPHAIERSTGRSALWYAAAVGSNDCILMLAEACASYTRVTRSDYVHSKWTDWGSSPILIAAAMNRPDTVETLMYDLGVYVDETNEFGSTACHIAASEGHTLVLDVLARNGADLNSGNNLGTTPAILAAQNNRVEVLRYLNDFRVDFRRVDHKGMCCAAVAAHYNKPEVLDFLSAISNPGLETSPDLNQPSGPSGDPPLCIAASRGNLEAIRALTKSPKCDLSAKNAGGMSALIIAVKSGRLPVVEALCSTAYPENLRNALNTIDDTADLMTPLFMSVVTGSADMVALLAPLSDLSVQCGSGDSPATALIAAAAKGDLRSVKTILEAGAAVDETDGRGHTALSVAARHGHAEVCEVLAKNGADLNARSKRGGGTPVQKARKYKHVKVVEVLERCSVGAGKILD